MTHADPTDAIINKLEDVIARIEQSDARNTYAINKLGALFTLKAMADATLMAAANATLPQVRDDLVGAHNALIDQMGEVAGIKPGAANDS